MAQLDSKPLEKLCKKPNAIRLLLAVDSEASQKELLASGVVSTGAYYGALKDLISLGLVKKVRKLDDAGEPVYYIALTEKGKKVRESLIAVINALRE